MGESLGNPSAIFDANGERITSSRNNDGKSVLSIHMDQTKEAMCMASGDVGDRKSLLNTDKRLK